MSIFLDFVLAMWNYLSAPQKKRRGIGALCSVLLHYLLPTKLVAKRYPNKDKCYSISGIIITRREVRRVTRREQLCILMKYDDFKYSRFYCFQKWFRLDTEGSGTYVFQYIE